MNHVPGDPSVESPDARLARWAARDASIGLAAEVQYIEVPGGNHTNVVEPNFAAMLDFFERFPRRSGR